MVTDERLIAQVRAGDLNAETELIERYKATVRYKARGYFLVGGDNEDLVQEGMIGLFKAIRGYQPERGASFRTFAELCIERQMMSAIQGATRKKQQPLNNYISFAEQVYGDDDPRELGDSLPGSDIENPETAMIAQESRQHLLHKLDQNLSAFEKEVLFYHMRGEGYQQIAILLDKPPKSIDNALQRIRKKLRQMVNKLNTIED